jgi:hypothetical protein
LSVGFLSQAQTTLVPGSVPEAEDFHDSLLVVNFVEDDVWAERDFANVMLSRPGTMTIGNVVKDSARDSSRSPKSLAV